MNDEELALMLSLQDLADESDVKVIAEEKINKSAHIENTDGLSLIDPIWETIDPIPDVHALFLQFDDRFFDSKLRCVEVRWSPRMTLCAGICVYQGKGGLCSIRLSQSLLKFRPRKDLIETLLHEMIHAYLFVTNNNRDRDGHGPNFKYHMRRINEAAGTKITIYHSFHDEVDNYKVHWWRCDGPCQKRRPFYGYVKRSMNRAPGPNDLWWKDHSFTCGGTFTKIKEPENYKTKNKLAKASTSNISSSENFGENNKLSNNGSCVKLQKHSNLEKSNSIDKFFISQKANESVNNTLDHIGLTQRSFVAKKLNTSTSSGKSSEVASQESSSKLKRNNLQKEGCDILNFLTPLKNPKIVNSIFDDSPDACSDSSLSQCNKNSYVFPGEGVRLGTLSGSPTSDSSLPVSRHTIPSPDGTVMSKVVAITQESVEIVLCPVCQKKIQLTDINAHLDICL